MVRKLTNNELRKLKAFDNLLKRLNSKPGFFSESRVNLNFRRKRMIEGVEIFLTHSLKEIEEEDI